MTGDIRRVGFVAELKDRQHDGLLELAEYDLGRHERVWKEDTPNVKRGCSGRQRMGWATATARRTGLDCLILAR